jgi:hypothetical protein
LAKGEDISARIRSHDVKKDWWTSAILITATGNKLNKAHVRYLEARLIAEAKSIGRMPLENSVAPGLPGLSEADQGKMEAFLENLLVVLPAVRVDMFIQRARSAPKPAAPAAALAEPQARFVIESRKHDITAHALLENGEFVVEQGSQAQLHWISSRADGYSKLHAELKHAGGDRGGGYALRVCAELCLPKPECGSGSGVGTAANGTTEWVNTTTSKTYKEWEASRIEATRMELA